MTLALFDLDNTLIGGDSDHLWGEFLLQQGHVDDDEFRQQNDAFYADYLRGELDMGAYLRFALEPLTYFTASQLGHMHDQFMRDCIEPIWLPKARDLVEKHRKMGHRLAVITATNRFIVEPIVARFEIDDLICSEPEVIAGTYTGEFIGTPCYAEGKVTCINAWLEKNPGQCLQDAWFYSDSHNDIPLLERVANPVVVDPDEKLAGHAASQGWQSISLR